MKSIPLSIEIVNIVIIFFLTYFFLSAPWGKGFGLATIGAFQSCRILQIQCYKDKIAAKRAELSRVIEDWQPPAELTSLLAGSGDS